MTPRLLLLGAVAAAIAAFFTFDLGAYLELGYLKARQDALARYVDAEPLRAATAYFAIYVVATGLSLPGAAVLTLIGGGLFGLLWGTVIVSFASTIGATLAFLLSRYLFRDAVGARFRERMRAINEGVERDGAFYLFTLRLVPIFPFFVINLVMGLTGMRVLVYMLVSQLGMLPATIVYVNAGTRLADVQSAADVLSLPLILSFAALGLFPLVARFAVRRLEAHRALSRWEKPRTFDRNLVVIGAGSAGLVAAYIAAATRASVTLVERDRMGGDCLNTGCVPSKALLRSAKIAHLVRGAAAFGVDAGEPAIDFATVMQRVHDVIGTIAPHDSVARYTSLGVECLTGEAWIVSPWRVRIGERELTTRHIVVAAGASPAIPPIPGLDRIDALTSETLWGIDTLPPRLLVLGGGPIGCELAQAFARLGSTVTLAEMAPRILPREDERVSATLRTALEADGVAIESDRRVIEFRGSGPAGSALAAPASGDGESLEIPFDRVVVAVGRRANTRGYGLEALGVAIDVDGTIATDAFLRTNFPNIYACGDVAGPYQFTHTASHEAWYASINSLFGSFRRFRCDYRVIPWCTFTDPEVAHVGLNELTAREQHVEYELTTYDIDDLDRAIADGVAHGFVRVLTVPGKDRILGATIVGEHAGDLIAEFVLAMKHGLGLNDILGTIHVYPTLAESTKFAAGAWRRAHAPEWALRIAARYHAWRRGA